MPICVPIKDLKDTAKFAKLVEEAPGPITVTRNGYDAFVVMRSEDYDALLRSSPRQRLLDRIAVAEKEKDDGRYWDYGEATDDLRTRYGI